MTLFLVRAMRCLGTLVLVGMSANALLAQTATFRIVSAANTFLATLHEKQRQSVMFAFDDERQRNRWSNFPISMVPRAGMSLGEMSPAQRSAAMALLSATLSQRGFEKVQQIMEGDEANKTNEANGRGRGPGGGPSSGRGNGPPFGRGGPPNGRGGAQFGKDLYYVSFLGAPSEKNPWMLQFGGHHLALNITIAGERGILTQWKNRPASRSGERQGDRVAQRTG
jgi:hypothetical protein